ncbi:hypothetical protein P691DRAFT_808011 [Macrolepiota fuliginosa MF-IS2]|uniref:Uncharacterized protein n=1 Tax=Macrolepiota fuliginosa MF-IS2 TaxID=1400762 RepID=A0A9P6BYB2_9AGAR|nr:hypothetical protein P691DRAFT_808011 [Macrolepiota fuliginosa MF-IS2]
MSNGRCTEEPPSTRVLKVPSNQVGSSRRLRAAWDSRVTQVAIIFIVLTFPSPSSPSPSPIPLSSSTPLSGFSFLTGSPPPAMVRAPSNNSEVIAAMGATGYVGEGAAGGSAVEMRPRVFGWQWAH